MEDTAQPSIDPTRLFGRVAVVTLALAGAALVLLPSTQFQWNELKGAWAARSVLHIADLTAALGIGLAFVIAWSRQAHRAAPLLGVALGAAAVAWGIASADAAQGLAGRGGEMLRAVEHCGWLLASGALSAFCTRFPRTVTQADIDAMQQRLREGRIGTGLTVREDPFVLMDAPLKAWDRMVGRVFGGSYRQRLDALEHRLGLTRVPGEQPAWMQRFQAFTNRWFALDAWLVPLACIPLLLVAAAFGAHDVVVVLLAVGSSVGMITCLVQRLMLPTASTEQRRQMLWIAAGFLGALMVVQLAFWVFIVSGFVGTFDAGTGVFILSAPIAALLVVLGFAIATFGSGALDPGLAIKRTLVTGIVATLVTFVFAVVEGLVANLLADQAGLPTAMAPAIASAAVAVALGPMWRKVSGWIGGKFGAALAPGEA